MRTEEMSYEDGQLAVQWLTERIRIKTGNENLSFPSDWIPETGMVVNRDDGELLAVATLYLEQSSPVGVCGWCISNPGNTAAVSYSAVKLLMSVIPTYAKKCGCKYLLTTFGDRGLNKILDECGYIFGENCETKFMIL